MFIVLEGVDGCGKSTQARLLADWLKSEGRDVLLTAEPTKGETGALIRSVLSGSKNVDPSTLALLFTADRMEHLAVEVEPALAEGKTVVEERYYYSTVAYQSAQGLDRGWLLSLNAFARKPDLALFIDIEPALAASRTSTGEIFEKEGFLRRVRENYLLFDELACVDGGGSESEVFGEVRQCVLDYAGHLK